MSQKTLSNPTKLFEKEVWIIQAPAQQICDWIDQLEDCQLATHSHGVMSTQHREQLTPIMLHEQLMFPEDGQTIVCTPHQKIIIRSGTQYHKAITLEIPSADTPESLTVSFDTSDRNLDVLAQIAGAVKSTEELTQCPPSAENYPSCCPGCLAKQAEIRKSPSIHPLCHIIESIDQSFSIELIHQGKRTHSRQAFERFQTYAHQGVVHLCGAERRECAIDLTQVYHVRIWTDTQRDSPNTQLEAFNSHGDRILELIHASNASFSLWNRIIEQQHHP